MQRFVPLIIIVALFGLFFFMLSPDRDPSDIANVKLGRPAPAFSIVSLSEAGAAITEEALKSGEPTIVNFFASWCIPCRAEHENLVKLAEDHNMRLVGIAYKDTPADSLRFLNELGNPFDVIGSDLMGDVGIEFGITGVPESYLVDGDGRIRYHFRGPIIGRNLEDQVLPEIEKLRQ